MLTPDPVEMRPGALIDYKLRVRGLPLRWRSEVTVWEPPHRFVDEQRRGPFRQWIHEHRFREGDGGVFAMDSVRMRLRAERWFTRCLCGETFSGSSITAHAGLVRSSENAERSPC